MEVDDSWIPPGNPPIVQGGSRSCLVLHEKVLCSNAASGLAASMEPRIRTRRTTMLLLGVEGVVVGTGRAAGPEQALAQRELGAHPVSAVRTDKRDFGPVREGRARRRHDQMPGQPQVPEAAESRALPKHLRRVIGCSRFLAWSCSSTCVIRRAPSSFVREAAVRASPSNRQRRKDFRRREDRRQLAMSCRTVPVFDQISNEVQCGAHVVVACSCETTSMEGIPLLQRWPPCSSPSPERFPSYQSQASLISASALGRKVMGSISGGPGGGP